MVYGGFPAAAGLLSDRVVTLSGLNPESRQGDRYWMKLLDDWGSEFRWAGRDLVMSPGWRGGHQEVDLSLCPDLFPILCVIASFRQGTTHLYGAPQLRHKESDRIAAMACGFRALNVSFEEREDGMLIHGGRPTGGQVDGFGDHRIYMAFSVMGLRTHGEVDVMGSRCSAVSYPNFHEDLARFC